jgi:hypothetical protein
MKPYIIPDLVTTLWFSFETWFSWITRIPLVKSILLSYPEIFSLGRAKKGGLDSLEAKSGQFETLGEWDGRMGRTGKRSQRKS